MRLLFPHQVFDHLRHASVKSPGVALFAVRTFHDSFVQSDQGEGDLRIGAVTNQLQENQVVHLQDFLNPADALLLGTLSEVQFLENFFLRILELFLGDQREMVGKPTLQFVVNYLLLDFRYFSQHHYGRQSRWVFCTARRFRGRRS